MLPCFSRLAAALAAAMLLAGCRPPPDPNDPAEFGQKDPEVLARNLAWASDFINERVAAGEISIEEGRERLSEYAGRLVAQIDLRRVEPRQAYRYADILRTARRWEEAIPLFETAVAQAKRTGNEDRRVNDSLRLAHCLAETNEFDEAAKLVRSTFDAKPKDKAPILMAILYEVVPAAEGGERDGDLAQLLEEAIRQHEAVLVDPGTGPGASFLAAKGFHIRRALEKVVELYTSAGMAERAAAARSRRAAQGSGRA